MCLSGKATLPEGLLVDNGGAGVFGAHWLISSLAVPAPDEDPGVYLVDQYGVCAGFTPAFAPRARNRLCIEFFRYFQQPFATDYSIKDVRYYAGLIRLKLKLSTFLVSILYLFFLKP